MRVHYRLAIAGRESAADRARAIALEQTVELPDGCYPPEIEQRVVGQIEEVEAESAGRARVVLSYSLDNFGNELLQVLNLLFGNISLQSGIRVERVEWPATLLERMPGPRLGIAGIRELCGDTQRRPLLCAALKPVGLSSVELAAICRSFALGGVDIIKDDHSLSDQPSAPLEERVPRCQEAVEQANRETGGHTVYFPNLSGDASKLETHVSVLRSAGCRGVLLAPLLAGLSTLVRLAREAELAVLAHPALTGCYFTPDHGLAPDLLLGQLFRIGGADGVIYPNVGGRFPFTAATCDSINRALRDPLGDMRPAFPMPAGGIDVERIPHWVERYGAETIFLIGGSLYRQKELTRATRRLMEQLGG